ncbi:hypothetical protein Acor_36830 [Acrocarpospora corrugata]|uniref:Uncharacterized protein n=1 Tax=Acrocarpospora corrugata TaxID=35763 RepID=A0A5M3W021_9ACTN|nr:hypothetical protein [Acrocarpospora corrugata]GES01619.1 hypothetical protein Acor_36830 [Acrocarpospora corrugata]
MVQPEATPRLTFSGWEDACMAYREYGHTRPEDREKAFLCRVRGAALGRPPMFPDTLPDEQVLGYGRLLCATSDQERRRSLLRRAGSDRSGWGAAADDLIFLCPEKIVAERPGLLHSGIAGRAAENEFAAEENARCADPWPRVRAVRQGTAAYFLFEGGGYGVFDAGAEIAEDIFGAASEDGIVAGSSAAVMTYGENEAMCLTVKAFGSAPPPRLRGWDEVAEVGIISRSGQLGVPRMEDGAEEGAGGRRSPTWR